MTSYKLVDFKTLGDERGSLIAIEQGYNAPFEIKRVYYIFDTKQGVERGFHAHINLKQIAIAVKGSCTFVLDDGINREEIKLDNPNQGLFIEGLLWREMKNFSPDCVLVVIASEHYDEKDYIRDYDKFLEEVKMLIKGKNINLRTVQIEDAEFIFEMRQNQDKTKYLSKVTGTVESQKEWIKNYKLREEDKKEFYFLIESKSKEKLGLVRMYDFKNDSFCWGSWLIKEDAPKTTAIESAIQIYEFGFYSLGFEKSHFDVRKGNDKVIAFHQRFGAKIVDEDKLDYFFNFEKSDYEITKKKYKRYL